MLFSSTRSSELDELNAEFDEENEHSSTGQWKSSFTIVAVAKGSTVEAYVIHDLDTHTRGEQGGQGGSVNGAAERVEHVADWDLESTVLGVSVNIVGTLLPSSSSSSSSYSSSSHNKRDNKSSPSKQSRQTSNQANSSRYGGGILVTSVCAQGVGWSWYVYVCMCMYVYACSDLRVCAGGGLELVSDIGDTSYLYEAIPL